MIVDFGDHYTGYFTFRIDHTGLPADAPLRFRLTFAEVPAELNTPFDPYPGGLSRAWLQDEVVTVMHLPVTVTLEATGLACRYVKIELLAQSYYDFRISGYEVGGSLFRVGRRTASGAYGRSNDRPHQ